MGWAWRRTGVMKPPAHSASTCPSTPRTRARRPIHCARSRRPSPPPACRRTRSSCTNITPRIRATWRRSGSTIRSLRRVATPPPAGDHIGPAPRVAVQAFCETVETAAAVQSAGEDRRLGKAHLKIQMGGMAAAIEAYRSAPTPNVIILETESRNDILTGLDQLASGCDPGTRGGVIGRINDVTPYRELVG